MAGVRARGVGSRDVTALPGRLRGRDGMPRRASSCTLSLLRLSPWLTVRGGVQDKRLVVLKEKAAKGNAAAQNEVQLPLTPDIRPQRHVIIMEKQRAVQSVWRWWDLHRCRGSRLQTGCI